MNKADKLVLAIHNEVDTAEARILQQCDEILSQNKISLESSIQRKAIAMRELGFVSSETVKQYEKIETKNAQHEALKVTTQKTAEYIPDLKMRYPLEKFITVGELERICTKYKLIHAPIANYIKDVPEKNVLEIKQAKSLRFEDSRPDEILFQYTGGFENKPSKEIIKQVRQGILIKETSWNNTATINNYFGYEAVKCSFNSFYSKETTIKYSGLFIAAPKSHFNLKGLSKKSKFGFFNISVREIKDPIVFEYCKNGICRIITKWGTSDDQSYLDSALVNQLYN